MFPPVERRMKKNRVGPRNTLRTPAEDHTRQNTDTTSKKLGKKLLRWKCPRPYMYRATRHCSGELSNAK